MIFTECNKNNTVFIESETKEKHIGLSNKANVLCLSSNSGGSYIYDALYESYIQAKIDSEDRLAFALKESMIISESDYSSIRAIQEAKVSDKIKSKWKKFIAFIKNLVAKFMESMTNILLDQKDYLEKYKDIIKKTPKEGMEYSYTGNYDRGIKRLINTEVPIFNYETYKDALEADDDSELVKAIIHDSEFSYNDGESLGEQFKNYFLVLDEGQKEGEFSDLNMMDLYNFCHDAYKIENMVNADIKTLEQSTKAIESAINKGLNDIDNAQPTTDKVENRRSDVADNKIQQQQNNDTKQTDNNKDTDKSEDENKSKNTNLKLTTNPISKMTSTEKRNSEKEKASANAGLDKAKADNKKADDISNAADKWIRVCNPLISAKLTACQQISKDYMEIIRAHVRSYVGRDKKEGNISTKPVTKYYKDAEKAQAEANKAAKNAESGN